MTTPSRNLRLARLPWIPLALFLALLAGCAKNPVTGHRELSLVSTSQELSIGKEGYGAVVSEYGIYDDPRLQAYVDSVGQSLARVSHLPTLQFKFTVLDDPTVNAFAMPGGYIYVTRGILAHLNSEAQLAGVLGHEIGHVTARHTARQITQQQLATLGLGVASIVSPTVQQYGQAAQQALGILFLKYSRDDETQADELGVEYATRAGYDPREIPNTYAMLKRVSDRSGQRLPAFLSTHPDPGNREARTTELARAAVVGKTGLRITARGYVERLDGVVFGNDPRQGWFDGATFYHPTLGFQFTAPAGWKTQNSHSAIVAAEPNQAAMLQLTLENAGTFTPEQYFSNLQTSGKITAARGASETVAGSPAWIGHIDAPGTNGATQVLIAAGVRRSPEQFFRFLGQSAAVGDANDAAIQASVRTLRPLTDAAHLAARPDRVRVSGAAKSGTFREVVAALGAASTDLEDIAILNNADAEQDVHAGELVKIVIRGRK
jgi:predicted Zn-dependent protease